MLSKALDGQGGSVREGSESDCVGGDEPDRQKEVLWRYMIRMRRKYECALEPYGDASERGASSEIGAGICGTSGVSFVLIQMPEFGF